MSDVQEEQYEKWYGLRQSFKLISPNFGMTLHPDLIEWMNQINENGVRVRIWAGSMINFLDDAAEAEFVLRFGSLTARP